MYAKNSPKRSEISFYHVVPRCFKQVISEFETGSGVLYRIVNRNIARHGVGVIRWRFGGFSCEFK